MTFTPIFFVMRREPDQQSSRSAVSRSWFHTSALHCLLTLPTFAYCSHASSDQLGGRGDETEKVFVQGGVYESTEDGATDSRVFRGGEIGDLAVDRFEVSNQEYDACVGDSACKNRRSLVAADLEGAFFDAFDRQQLATAIEGLSSPVTHISFSDANAYCAWRGGRLPTALEWVWIATGRGQGVLYSWGNQPPTCRHLNAAFFNEDGTDSNYVSCYHGPIAVDARLEDISPQGVYHMMGNVQEFTSTVVKIFHEGRGLVESAIIMGSALCWNPITIKGMASVPENMPIDNNRGSLTVGFRCVR